MRRLSARPRLNRMLAGGAAAAALLHAAPLAGQLRNGPGGEPPLELPRIGGPIEIDGVLDEPAWGGAAVLEGVVAVPDFGAEPSQRGEFLLAHDGEYLYLGCIMYESDPGLIRITTLERDVSPYQTDSCGMRLDSYNDEENSLVFITTPASVRTDWTFANDATGPPNREWDTFWDAAGTVTDFGWSAEVRIPFSSVGFQVIDDRVVMGFSVTRTIVRNAESIVHPAIPPEWGAASVAKPTQLRKMILRGLEPEKPVYLTPYLLGGGGHTHALDESAGRYDRTVERVAEIGGDLRYGITRNLNLDLSVNTDFAQVEADDQQVNLTRFSLFFPEQRRFFQERNQIFQVPLGFNERLFHSRRIGLAQGRPIPIYGGGRLVGRIGEWDVGLIDMQTEAAGAIPSENLGVGRIRRRVLNDASYMGGIVTSRIGEDGGYNVLYGADASLRLFGQDFLTLNWSQSFDAADDRRDRTGPMDRSLARVHWERRGNDGATYRMSLAGAGAAFEPGMGFVRRRDYLAADGSLGYGWRPGVGATLNRYGVAANGQFFRRNGDGSIESGRVGVSGVVETRGSHRLTAEMAASYEDLTETFVLSEGAAAPAGSYWFGEASLSYAPPSGNWFRPNAYISGGGFYDGTRLSAGISPTWSASRHVRLSAMYELNRVRFHTRGERFTAHLARLRTALTLSTRTSASAFVQYNSAGDLIVVNLRFRYNPREGNDIYVVWNETFNQRRSAPGPVVPLSEERTLLLKFSRTLTLGLYQRATRAPVRGRRDTSGADRPGRQTLARGQASARPTSRPESRLASPTRVAQVGGRADVHDRASSGCARQGSRTKPRRTRSQSPHLSGSPDYVEEGRDTQTTDCSSQSTPGPRSCAAQSPDSRGQHADGWTEDPAEGRDHRRRGPPHRGAGRRLGRPPVARGDHRRGG